ncbi:replication-associated protein [Odonata-associated circular virus-2]|uniref:replication-associated protein n=1 Tax=Odonata-associated circular virus-2 TaxID=1592120 RepID=UPI000585CC02|nr:replication-associated protein [Odonata-associated circular virus-2]AJD07489.1 replication-associated protein [Odonata-associated circular virus-2]
MPFVINARKFLLTYPQCQASKEEVLARLQSLGEIKWYTVAIELHEDGSPHLHSACHYSKKIHTTNCRFFDFGATHCNIQTLKTQQDFERAESYCRKHGNFISNYDTKVPKRVLLAKKLIDHGQIDYDFIQENPEIIFFNYSSLNSYLSLVPKKKVKLNYPTMKQRHIWLHGPSNSGKTTWLRDYLTDRNHSEIPTNNDWCCNEATNVLWIDEYKGCLTIQQLNKLCDGDTQLNRKGGSTRILFPTIVILSNFNISAVYNNASDDMKATLYNRFIEYDSSVSFPPVA